MKLTKHFAIVLAAVMVLVGWSSAVHARGVGGSSEVMFYVADIAIPPAETGGEQVALCHLVKKYGIVGIPIFYSSVAYVLGPNNCNADNYYMMTPEEFAQARTIGLIGADIPVTPSISFARRIPTIIFGIIFVVGMAAFLRQQRRKRAETP